MRIPLEPEPPSLPLLASLNDVASPMREVIKLAIPFFVVVLITVLTPPVTPAPEDFVEVLPLCIVELLPLPATKLPAAPVGAGEPSYADSLAITAMEPRD
jgi:hypothetical protein